MALIRDEDKKYLMDEFAKKLKNPVDLVVFTSNNTDCKYCKETVQLAEEVATLSDKINLVKYVYETDKDLVEKYGVEKYPATIVAPKGVVDGRIVYYGIPSGYEFGSLIEDLENVSIGDADVSKKAVELISKVDKPITIKVYVTPTCQYCPRAVGTAHKFALLNKNIKGEMIESLEFDQEASDVGVSAVPHIVINDDVTFVGAYPDDQFAEYVMEAYNHEE
ncbi:MULTISPECIES: thioredoxin family protein [Acidiplasma]|jgi:glutaredoxin-like protein|uniref:Glutaredoxin n=2 Tax=Acidiplasma TaxID=507753 RepID=A0A0Q0VNC0_9ARCH|nr:MULTISPECIES: thioredoxin family protein [Acidiplasma]KJE49486.1 glutaredoxin [Acidiplasma sp. MBA-1]KPV47106.1 glutaredoxin [Acidiplasma aeolicum]KQB34369.1 glutaredoxin [Acidiplasma aeolicum]KQB34939.1 glutaredoxin [Acidiplasma cupricumulans]WMT54531.1 MAG: thioredoxin family protein [Acidiplasma sp.]